MKSKVILTIPFILLLSLFSACEEESSISFEDSVIEYDRSVTRMEANRLGRYLKSNGYFEKGNRQEVIISKEDYDYELSWEVEDDFVPRPEALTYYYDLIDSLQKHVFEKSGVLMILYSERNRYEMWGLNKEMPSYFQSANHIIYYKEPITKEIAMEFGEILDNQDFLNPQGEVFMLEEERDRIILGLASGNRKSNEFKTKFSELRANLLADMEGKKKGLVFEIRGALLDGIEETIAAPFYPKSTSANGIKIKYDSSVTGEDISLLREHIKNNRLRSPEWVVFVRTEDRGIGRYKLIMPPSQGINDPVDIEKAKNFAIAMSMKLLGSYVDVVLLDENTGMEKMIKAESMK